MGILGQNRLGWDRKFSAYALGGEDFAAAVRPPLGLPLPERGSCCAAFGVPEGAAVVRCAEGEDAAETEAAALAVAGKSAPNAGLSWGAGEGAIVMAVLMVKRAFRRDEEL